MNKKELDLKEAKDLLRRAAEQIMVSEMVISRMKGIIAYLLDGKTVRIAKKRCEGRNIHVEITEDYMYLEENYGADNPRKVPKHESNN